MRGLELEDNVVVVTCYRQSKQMKRGKAMNWMLDCMKNSEGSEHERYENIYWQLAEGKNFCSDE